jgi:hypothetical protein
MNEATIKAALLKRLSAFGGLWRKTWGGPYAAPGVFDIIGCIEGKYVAIELKHPKYKNPKAEMTSSQWNFYTQVKANGGIAIVGNDADAIITELEDSI